MEGPFGSGDVDAPGGTEEEAGDDGELERLRERFDILPACLCRLSLLFWILLRRYCRSSGLLLGQAAMIGQSGCLSWWCRWAHCADSGVFSLETVFQRAPGIFFYRLSGVIAAGQGHFAVLYCHLIEAWLPCASHTLQPITALSATHPIPFSASVKSSAATDEESSFSSRQRAASSPLVFRYRLGWLLSYIWRGYFRALLNCSFLLIVVAVAPASARPG